MLRNRFIPAVFLMVVLAPCLSAQNLSNVAMPDAPENTNVVCALASCSPFAVNTDPGTDVGSPEVPVISLPEKPVPEKSHDKPWLLLSITAYAMAMGDAAQTAYHKGPNAEEVDVLARPFVSLPTPIYLALAGVATTGTNYLAYRMKHSSHRWENKIWWLPQTLQIAGNAYGISATAYSFAK